MEYADVGIHSNNPPIQVIAEAVVVFGENASIAGAVSVEAGQKWKCGWLPINVINVLREVANDSGRVSKEMA